MPTYQPDEVPVWAGETNYNDEYQGMLYLTKKRLFFERMIGAIRKRVVRVAEIRLTDMKSASVEKGPWDWTVLSVVAGGKEHRFLFRAKSPDELIKQLGELMASQKEHEKRDEARPLSK